MNRFVQTSAYYVVFIISTLFLPALAYGQGQYYLEIGEEVERPKADSQWKTLSAKHKSLLGKLDYFPKTVYRDGQKDGTRIQAGPIESKDAAQKICHTLFAADTPCFVIENLQQAPPRTVTSLNEGIQERVRTIQIVTQAPVVLPWLENSQAQAQEAEEDNGSLWSWLVGDEDDGESDKTLAAPAPVTISEPSPIAAGENDLADNRNGSGDVEVAEAIRVPLSQPVVAQNTMIAISEAAPESSDSGENNDTLPSVSMLESNPVVTTSQVMQARRAPIANPSTELATPEAGWLNIATFRNESDATETWQRVRKAIPEKAAGLRVRIIRPFISEKPNTTLNVGPFASSTDAMDFCSAGVKPVDSSLECMFTHDGNSMAAARYPAALSPAAGGKARKALSKQYWVEVLTASSQLEALNAWEDLRTAHSDLFVHSRSNVSRLGNKKRGYVVRVGPLPENDDAQQLCRNLRSRQLDCAIVMSSR